MVGVAVWDDGRGHRDSMESRQGVAGGGEDTCQVEHPMADLVVYIKKIVHFVFCHDCCACGGPG